MIRFLIGFLRECWYHLSGQWDADMLKVAEGRSGRVPVCEHCDRIFHNDHHTITACRCGGWTADKLYTGCQCIAAQPRCTELRNFTVRVNILER